MSSLITLKEQAIAPKPLFLCQIAAVDGDACYLASIADVGVTHITYGGHDYLCRLQNQAIDAIQAMSPQGYDVPPAFNLTIADGDFFLWTNHCVPHGWRGATLTVLFVMYDIVAGAYSSDSYQWTFILGNPKISAKGVITVDSTTLQNMQRQKVPSVPRQRRCPWVFPATSAQRFSGVNDSNSIYFQCGYSPDQIGGDGNYSSGTTPFTTCDYTRESCVSRGMFSADSLGHQTGRFGGDTWQAPIQYSGRKYTSGEKVFGYNTPNTGTNEYYNFLYGRQWVDCTVLEPAAEPNSLRAEAVVCVATTGPVDIDILLVNGVQVPFNNRDALFTWRWLNQGGKNGTINQDAIFNGQGDPHGSLATIEFVVPVELAAGGSIPKVQALAAYKGIATFDAFRNFAGFVFSTNPIWHLVDLLTWANYTYDQMDLVSAYNAAVYCDTLITYTDLTGASTTHERFRSSFVLAGTQRQTLAQAIAALRNNAGIMLRRDTATGLVQFAIKQTLGEQQPALVAGSNYSTPVTSQTAAGVVQNGFLAYLFDGSSIEKDSLQIDTRAIADTPNRVTFPFQDKDNQYQLDSLSIIDPDAYASSGNMEVDLPFQVLGIDNFDQGQRRSNAELSQALRGNPRDDAGGTLYLNFTTSVKAIHLLSQPGAICGLTYTQLGL